MTYPPSGPGPGAPYGPPPQGYGLPQPPPGRNRVPLLIGLAVVAVLVVGAIITAVVW